MIGTRDRVSHARGLVDVGRFGDVGPATTPLVARTDKKRSPLVQRLVLETQHPYAHNADRRETVRIEGARKLLVTFDERTRWDAGEA